MLWTLLPRLVRLFFVSCALSRASVTSLSRAEATLGQVSTMLWALLLSLSVDLLFAVLLSAIVFIAVRLSAIFFVCCALSCERYLVVSGRGYSWQVSTMLWILLSGLVCFFFFFAVRYRADTTSLCRLLEKSKQFITSPFYNPV